VTPPPLPAVMLSIVRAMPGVAAADGSAHRTFLMHGTGAPGRRQGSARISAGVCAAPTHVPTSQRARGHQALIRTHSTARATGSPGHTSRRAFRGRGLGADVVVALCEYGFAVRGLHRLQVDTLAGNTAMIRAAERAGFVPEGRLRQAAWAGGDFADVVILGLLAAGWDGGRRHPGEGEVGG
jgi:hypothetical protein